VPADATGWSVLVKGRAVEVDDADEVRAVARLPLQYWSVGYEPHWVRILPTEVSGRRIWNGAAAPVPVPGTIEEVHDGARPDRG